MNESIKISVRQFSLLVIFYTVGTTILIIPGSLAADAKQDAWIAAILGTGIGWLLMLLYNRVGSLFPHLTLVQVYEEILGRWVGKTVSFLFLFFCFIGAATLLFYMGNFITTQVMPETPIPFINILFFALVVMGLRLGLETLARAAEIFFPWFVMLFFVLFAFLSPEIRLERLQPVLETGIQPLLKAALIMSGTASLTVVVLLMIFPACVNQPAKAARALPKSIIVGGCFIILITFLTVSVLGVDITMRQMYPSYALAKKISVGGFVERIESLMAGMWFITIFFKITLYFYGCVAGLAQTLRLKDYRSLTLPMGMLVVVYSTVVYPNVDYMAKWDSTVYIPYVLTIGLLLPLLLLGVAAFRKASSK